MKLRTFLAAVAALAVAPAFAQALGTVTSVNGVATVVSGGSATTLTPGMTLANGSRIVTTSSSSVVLSMNSGCTVTVPPGHGVTLLSTLTCQQLQASRYDVLCDQSVLGEARKVLGLGSSWPPPLPDAAAASDDQPGPGSSTPAV